MESQAGVYSINAQPGYHGRVQLYVTLSATLNTTTEEVFTVNIKFCKELLKEAKNINNIF